MGYKFSEEQLQIIRSKRKPVSKNTKDKISQAKIGKKMTDEAKNKISQANKNREPWNKGKTNVYSKETILKMKKC